MKNYYFFFAVDFFNSVAFIEGECEIRLTPDILIFWENDKYSEGGLE